MNIAGVVCEYNPFHSGHEYHLKKTRELVGEDSAVLCIMSGDFVQRGESALYAKHARAEAACRSGADLVIELPLPWAISSAEGFARGAVGLLSALGASHISFGSEAGELAPLEALANELLEPGLIERTKELLGQDAALSFAAARQKAAEERLGPQAKLLEQPNNILAIEYLKAIVYLDSKLKPITVRRIGSGHDRAGEEGPRSASELRLMTRRGESTDAFIPAGAAAVYARERERGRVLSERQLMETAMLSRLRMFDEEYFSALPDGAEGLGSRLFRAVRREASLDAVLAAAKTRRYALSRIRRMCLCACLGVKEGMNRGLPPYGRILAANQRGCLALRSLEENSRLPLITKPAAVKKLSAECADMFALGAYAHDFYVLGFRAKDEKMGGEDWRSSPFIVQN